MVGILLFSPSRLFPVTPCFKAISGLFLLVFCSFLILTVLTVLTQPRLKPGDNGGFSQESHSVEGHEKGGFEQKEQV